MTAGPGRDALAPVTWPRARAGDALTALANRAGLASGAERGVAPLGPEALAHGGEALGRYLEAIGARLRVEVVASTSSYQGLAGALGRVHPALLELPSGDFVALLGGGARSALALGPDLTRRRVALADLAAAVRAPLEASAAAVVDPVLDAAGLGAATRARARQALLDERLAGAPIAGLFLVRRASDTPFRLELGDGHAGAKAALLLLATVALYLLTIAAWVTLGSSVLDGRVDAGWLAAWLFLLISLVPTQLLARWLQSELSVAVGAALKRRILAGALRLDVDALRLDGAGLLMGRAVDGTQFDQVFIRNGIQAAFSVIELVGAGLVLATGAGGGWHAALLAAFVALTLALLAHFARRHRRWASASLEMTRELVEHMVGNRTRLAQHPAERWHDDEDRALERFVALTRAADGSVTALFAAPRVWQLVGFLGLGAGFVAGATPAALAVGVGGVQLAFQALARLVAGGQELVLAWTAWDRIGPLFRAAARREMPGHPDAVVTPGQLPKGSLVIDASGLAYTFPARLQPSLREVTLEIRGGDRVLVEGPSGGGKSTLAALLAGQRAPSEGVLLVGGLDAPTLGADGWRRRVAAAPQFHENHVLCETFAFNLLFGRRWPPHRADLEEAGAVCRELGLGPLLERMPAGMMQMVGEGGWQLSHGERSRLYLARALLQNAEVVILDETFGALDPETLEQCVDTVLRRARTLVVIAHP
jgi:ATP-binding cassette subfamily B protein